MHLRRFPDKFIISKFPAVICNLFVLEGRRCLGYDKSPGVTIQVCYWYVIMKKIVVCCLSCWRCYCFAPLCPVAGAERRFRCSNAGVAPKAGLFTNQVLNEINPQVDHCLVNATYVNDFYGYVLRYPGLARIDDYGYQSTGYVRGNLHRTTVDTIIGAVKIYHPQEGHLYQLADRDNALPVESGADGTRPPQPTLQPVAFGCSVQ